MVGNLLHAGAPAGTERAEDTAPVFDVRGFLESAGLPRRVARFAAGATVFAQGAVADSVYFILDGGVKLTVLSSGGKEAVVAILGAGDFFGEGCLTSQPHRVGNACALISTGVLYINKVEMMGMLHRYPEFAASFIAQMLLRNIRIQEDLVDQLFNSSEKRLARTLLLLARAADGEGAGRETLPRLSQETLARMVGTTRSRVNFFMNKFRRLGLIEYRAGAGVHRIDAARLGAMLD